MKRMARHKLFSVIIPTLNEGGTIEACIAHVQELDADVEIIVADGGSGDDTRQRAVAAGAKVCRSPRGRGTQLHAGATAAAGDLLLFLHADTFLPDNAFALLRNAFANKDLQIGTFRLSFPASHWMFRLYATFSAFDSLLTTFGDQCIVVRSRFYTQMGGFPPWPLFEDVALLQEARRRTKIKKFPAAVVTSDRRYTRNGVILHSLRNAWFVLRYLLGASPFELAVEYERRGSER
jgi:rSAM/selenodomain-associated transferase 2